MRLLSWKFGVLVLAAVVTAAWAMADGPATTKPADPFVLTLHSVYGVEPRQWVFVLKTPAGGIGITGSDQLQQYIELVVPKNATLQWMPGCDVIGGEPMRTQKELDAFAEFCRKQSITFVIVPAG